MAFDVIRDEDQRKEIVNYLQEEYNKALSEREPLERKWSKWRRQSEGRPETDTKSYPWPNAANVSVPLTATATNGIYASTKATFQRKPLCTVSTEGEDPEWTDHAEALTRYINILIESSRYVDFRKLENTLFRDWNLLGTQFVEVPWTLKRWMFKRRSPDGSVEQVSQVQKNCPTIVPIRLEDMIMRGYFSDPQTAPWYGIRYRFAEHEIRREEALGNFENVDQLEPSNIIHDENIEKELHRRGIDLRETELYEIVKFHYYYDIDDDGFPEDIVIWMHVDSGIVVREEFNDLGIRPVVRAPYVDLTGQLYAIGVGWMLEHLQDEVDALHNMRIDGTQLSMLQIIIARRGAGIGPNEEFYPLKILFVDNPQDDVNIIKFPDIASSSISAESIARQYGMDLVGANSAFMGFPDEQAKTRATASGQMLQLQRSNLINDAVQDNLKDALSKMFEIIVFQLVRNRDLVDLTILKEEDQVLVQEVLAMNVEDIPHRFRFRVQTSEADQTIEQKRQAKLMLMDLYARYGQGIFQLAPVLFDPSMPPPMKEIALKFFTGANEIMSDILKFFGEEDVRKFIPYDRDIVVLQEAIERQKDAQIGGALNVQQRGPGPGPVGGGIPQGPVSPVGR